MIEQIAEEPAQIFAMFGEIVQLAQRPCGIAVQNGPGQREDLAARGQAEHGKHIRSRRSARRKS